MSGQASLSESYIDNEVKALPSLPFLGEYSSETLINPSRVLQDHPGFAETWKKLQGSLDSLSRLFFSNPRLLSFVDLTFDCGKAHSSWEPTTAETPGECSNIFLTLLGHVSDAGQRKFSGWPNPTLQSPGIKVEHSGLQIQGSIADNQAIMQVAIRMWYYTRPEVPPVAVDLYSRVYMTKAQTAHCDSDKPVDDGDTSTLCSLDSIAKQTGIDSFATSGNGKHSSRFSQGGTKAPRSALGRRTRSLVSTAADALTGCFVFSRRSTVADTFAASKGEKSLRTFNE